MVAVNDRVRIVAGAFAGIDGVAESVNDSHVVVRAGEDRNESAPFGPGGLRYVPEAPRFRVPVSSVESI